MVAAYQYENKEYEGNYNIGPNENGCVTTGALVDLFVREWGENISWIDKSDGGPHEANFLKLDCSLIKNKFEWNPRWNIETAVKKSIEWTKVWKNEGNIKAAMEEQICQYMMLNE